MRTYLISAYSIWCKNLIYQLKRIFIQFHGKFVTSFLRSLHSVEISKIYSHNFLKKNSWNQLIHKWNYISYWFHVISDTESKFPFFSTLYCALIFNEMEKFHLYSKIAISEQILKTFLKVMTLVSNLVLLTLDRPIPMIRYQMNVFVKYTSVIIVSHTVWKFRKLLKLCKENNTYIWFRKAGLSIKEKQKLNWF